MPGTIRRGVTPWIAWRFFSVPFVNECNQIWRGAAMKRIFRAATCVAAICVSFNVSAQVYPSRAITIVVPFAAGGPADALARLLGEKMHGALGQPMIVENVVGAAGTTGVGRIVRAAPDGYTIGIGHWSTHVLN